MGQLWKEAEYGRYLYADELSMYLRVQSQPVARFRVLMNVKDGSQKGLHAGDEFRWNMVLNIGNAGGRIQETQRMPESSFKIKQYSTTVYEMGNSIPYTGLLNDLSKQPLEEIIDETLMNDAAKAFDREAHTAMQSTVVKVQCDSASSIVTQTDGTFAGTSTSKITKAHVQVIVDDMAEANVPPYDGSNYVATGRRKAFRTLRSELEAIHFYVESGFSMISRGEMGRYENCRFQEQTNIANPTDTEADVYFCGADTGTEIVCIPEEMRGKIGDDYGRSMGVAWYYLGGFANVRPDATDPRIWHARPLK